MSVTERRLPVYLLLDCSESMAGEAISSVTAGIDALVAGLKGNAQALETCWLSVIAFSKNATQVVPLTELLDFHMPKLSVRPGTAFGAAIKMLVECLEREMNKTTENTKGDYRALVFLLTDGQPTDNWEPAVELLRSQKISKKIANFYAIGCGQDVDFSVLRHVSDIVLWLKDLNPDMISKLFIWLTASVQTASETANRNIQMPDFELPAFLQDARVRNAELDRPRGKLERQVFIHALCVNKKLPYLMRFALAPDGKHYEVVTSHKLDVMEPGDDQLLPTINTSLLNGCPPCPHCGNPRAVMCPCGSLLCAPRDLTEMKEPITCPRCKANLMGTSGEVGHFDIKQIQG